MLPSAAGGDCATGGHTVAVLLGCCRLRETCFIAPSRRPPPLVHHTARPCEPRGHAAFLVAPSLACTVVKHRLRDTTAEVIGLAHRKLEQILVNAPASTRVQRRAHAAALTLAWSPRLCSPYNTIEMAVEDFAPFNFQPKRGTKVSDKLQHFWPPPAIQNVHARQWPPQIGGSHAPCRYRDELLLGAPPRAKFKCHVARLLT